MASFDDTRRILCSDDRRRGSAWLTPALGRSDVARVRGRLRLLASLLAELAPPRSLAFLIDPVRMRMLSPGRETRHAEHIRICVSDILSGDTVRGLRRLEGRGLTPRASGGLAEGLLVAVSITERGREDRLTEERRFLFEEARTGDTSKDTVLLAASDGLVHESIYRVVSAMARGSGAEITPSVLQAIAARGCHGADALVGMCLALRTRLPERLAARAPAGHHRVGYRTSTIFRTADFPPDSSRRK